MHWVGMPSTPGDARLLIFLIAAIISSTVKGVFKARAAFFLLGFSHCPSDRELKHAVRSLVTLSLPITAW